MPVDAFRCSFVLMIAAAAEALSKWSYLSQKYNLKLITCLDIFSEVKLLFKTRTNCRIENVSSIKLTLELTVMLCSLNALPKVKLLSKDTSDWNSVKKYNLNLFTLFSRQRWTFISNSVTSLCCLCIMCKQNQGERKRKTKFLALGNIHFNNKRLDIVNTDIISFHSEDSPCPDEDLTLVVTHIHFRFT